MPRCLTRSRMTGAAKATSSAAAMASRHSSAVGKCPHKKVCNRSLMKVQQAPSPVQASLLLPASVAFSTAQLKKGGTTSQSSASTSKVISVFESELNRLRRSQSIARAGPPRGPSNWFWRSWPGATAAATGESAVIVAPSAATAGAALPGGAGGSAAALGWSLLHQGDAPVVPVHEGRAEQIDGQEDRH